MNQNTTINNKLHSNVSRGLEKLFGFNWLSKVVARTLLKLKQSF